ncbi:hypothetical protein BH23CHL2_BH23CHL2_00020 [soil metagenome]
MTNLLFTSDIDAIAAVLRRGGTAIVPTDTVYGLAASLEYPAAIARLYELKKRPDGKPIPILISGPEVLQRLATGLSGSARTLIESFWPGPLTLVVQASGAVPTACLSGGATVGLRMPDHPDLLGLLEACGGALAVTSANASGQPETTSAAAAFDSLNQLPDIVLDCGDTPGGLPSTVVDTLARPPVILRSGRLDPSTIFELVGES